jgi:GDPmannose 4,6-dehydratase
MPRALITGIAGQDGLLLARYLLSLEYEVVGTVQFGSAHERQRIHDLVGDIGLVTADMTDLASLLSAIRLTQPDEVYNLAGISSVRVSWEQPARVAEVNGIGLVNLLEALRAATPTEAGRVRVFQASSAQMFGEIDGEWFSESTPLRPTSPYGASKAFAHLAADSYRRRYGMFVSCGILGNHVSALHDAEFVVPRITRAVGRIAAGLQEKLVLDNLTATRDWGYACDFVTAMHATLQCHKPEDFVIATGELRSVRDVVSRAFFAAGVADWKSLVATTGADNGRAHHGVRGDIRKARRLLGWTPRTTFEQLITMMVEHELDLAQRTPTLPPPRVVAADTLPTHHGGSAIERLQ